MKTAVDNLLVIFTRYPSPGTTKTRLIPVLGPKGAADLQRQMTEHLVRKATALRHQSRVALEIRYAGGNRESMARWLGRSCSLEPQGSGKLGARLQRAFTAAFDAGHQRVIIAGADCPRLSTRHLEQSIAALQTHDLTLGPARDGGYYLIGLRRPHATLFTDIPWGSDQVLARTLQRARSLSLSFFLLETLPDVDRPEDLRHYPGSE